MRRLIVIFLLVSFSAFANQVYYDLGSLEPEEYIVFDFREIFPQLEKISVINSLAFFTSGESEMPLENYLLECSSLDLPILTIAPTYSTPPGEYRAFFQVEEADKESLLILTFSVKPKLELKIDPLYLYLESEPRYLECEIKANCNWELYCFAAQEYPEIIVSVENKDFFINDLPQRILSQGKTKKNTFFLKVNLGDPTKSPTGRYYFPLNFTLIPKI
ncbi:MAG TPA: hypothetical protein GX522_00060 [Firmicutes bacterium]|nr:hypothetical protein [Bacillota bacterium]